MLDRGLRRRFPRRVEEEADAIAPAAGDGRVDLRDLPTFTIDPDDARDFDDAVSAARQDDGTIRVWVHIADVCAHVAPGGAIETEAQRARHQRVRARRGGADAARGAVERRVLAAPGRGQAGGHGGDGHARHRGAPGAVPAHAHPQRPAADLRPGRRDLRRRGPGRGAVGRPAGGGARGGGRAGRAAPRRRRAGGGQPRAVVRVRRRRPRDRRRARAADRVARADRAPDDPGQRAGGGLPGRPQAAHPLPRAREARSAQGRRTWSSSWPRWTCPPRRCPSR